MDLGELGSFRTADPATVTREELQKFQSESAALMKTVMDSLQLPMSRVNVPTNRFGGPADSRRLSFQVNHSGKRDSGFGNRAGGPARPLHHGHDDADRSRVDFHPDIRGPAPVARVVDHDSVAAVERRAKLLAGVRQELLSDLKGGLPDPLFPELARKLLGHS